MRLPRIAVWAAGVAGLVGACTRIENVTTPPGVATGDGGQSGADSGADAGSGSVSAGHAGEGPDDMLPSAAGAPAGAELGLWPTYVRTAPLALEDTAEAADEAGDADAADAGAGVAVDVEAVLSAVSAISLGSATLPLYVPWSELSTSSGAPRESAWAQLDALVQPYAEAGKRVALCVGVVDRAEPAWPFDAEPGSTQAERAIERTVDELLARYGASLSHLCFGHEVDRYLERAPAAAGARVVSLLAHALSHAQQQRTRAVRPALGISVTLTALASGAAFHYGLPLADEIVAVLDPLESGGALKSPSAAVGELEAALGALPEALAAPLPLMLFEAGYPGAGLEGATEEAQQAFYQALLASLDEHVERFSFVGLFGLHDRAADECESEARAFGGSPELQARRALARCSIGLRPASGPRLAWPLALSALSRYR